MTIKVNFTNPETISTAGVSNDNVKLTFWSNEHLEAENGLRLEEGLSIVKGLIP